MAIRSSLLMSLESKEDKSVLMVIKILGKFSILTQRATYSNSNVSNKGNILELDLLKNIPN